MIRGFLEPRGTFPVQAHEDMKGVRTLLDDWWFNNPSGRQNQWDPLRKPPTNPLTVPVSWHASQVCLRGCKKSPDLALPASVWQTHGLHSVTKQIPLSREYSNVVVYRTFVWGFERDWNRYSPLTAQRRFDVLGTSRSEVVPGGDTLSLLCLVVSVEPCFLYICFVVSDSHHRGHWPLSAPLPH